MQQFKRVKTGIVYFLWLSVVSFLTMWTELSAQSIQLRERNTNKRDISVQVGDIVTVDVYADLSSYEAAAV